MENNLNLPELNNLLSESDTVSILSTNNDVTIKTTPNLYYDDELDMFSISGGWSWKNHNYLNDLPSFLWIPLVVLEVLKDFGSKLVNHNIAIFDESPTTSNNAYNKRYFNKTNSSSMNYSSHGIGFKHKRLIIVLIMDLTHVMVTG
ncbi:hypothetical protein KHA80_15710 [Anaerobacillus sp. HL2]|nr:hypothetical protein KHA80_15710 [Anaerobacillus sp. HL2]